MPTASDDNADADPESGLDDAEGELVWYTAFGSNLSSARFRNYLVGGTPARSTNPAPQQGARDATPPRDTWAGRIPGELYFGATSDRWGGCGVAFFDPTTREAETLVRAYLISVPQLEDVYRQENRADAIAPIDLVALTAADHLDLYPSRYGRLAVVGTHDDGRAMVTITSADRQVPNAPHDSYLLTICDGLREAFDLGVDDLISYLGARVGLAGTDAGSHLAERLREN